MTDIDLRLPPRDQSASERWGEHYLGSISKGTDGCPICQVGDEFTDEDILCDIGRKLRDASIAEAAAYVEPPEEMLTEARKALWEAQVALNHAVTYHFSGSYLEAQRRMDQARTWLRFADGRVGAAAAEITGGES